MHKCMECGERFERTQAWHQDNACSLWCLLNLTATYAPNHRRPWAHYSVQAWNYGYACRVQHLERAYKKDCLAFRTSCEERLILDRDRGTCVVRLGGTVTCMLCVIG